MTEPVDQQMHMAAGSSGAPSAAEPALVIHSREQLLHTLSEAAEIEHNLMCCYLYASWSLKTEADDPPDERDELQRWRRIILDVAIDEMAHLALVGNLMNAIGGVAHFNRPNFPIAPGYHPAAMQVRLAPFNRDTLQHFVHLERPEGDDEPDGAGFAHTSTYVRGLHGLTLTPTAQDYLTVGHLYRSVEAGLRALSETLGEAALFCGDPALQVGPSVVGLKGLIAVTDLASACQAIATIVEQGEGAQDNAPDGHYHRFISVREAYEAMLARNPDFVPAHPAATNPVMRKPPDPQGRVWVANAEAQSVLDLANATYELMLQCLAQGFAANDQAEKKLMIDAAIKLMQAVDPLGKQLARIKANDQDACNAGMSFAALRQVASPAAAQVAIPTFAHRLKTLVDAGQAQLQTPRMRTAVAALERVHAQLAAFGGKPLASAFTQPQVITAAAPGVAAQPALPTAQPPAAGQPEIVEGEKLTLIVDGQRCIHARHCVTGAPKTFVANVVGPWLHPDETDVETLVGIAHACPSGAVAYRRKDGKTNEAAPPVNMLRLRENGPYAIHAPLVIAGGEQGFRATLCRCGASKNKPYCDGSHAAADFVASGEPATVSLEPLAARDGTLQIEPQQNGPLAVSGNLELCTGNGRVVQRVTETRLCRCGHSQAKPFCDGSHRAIGFIAPGA
ncbi:ferritin-like domain-containing protein [Andreprevotia chitinilytica]|uniref:ferritin-like domain-containing protein n=1 Tax=Andreprevotia chitinilytica TaxID=396808 RepID=UPI0009FD171A|nr:ferritin-like domain-containing protein [Andreprevotia chitinilytica]